MIRVVYVLRFTEVLPVFLICFACTQQHRACVHDPFSGGADRVEWHSVIGMVSPLVFVNLK